MIRFACPSCHKSIHVDDNHAGKKGKCPKCGHAVVVPEQSTLIEFDCEDCGHTIKVPGDYAGKTGRCPKCKSSIIVPAAHAEPLEPEVPAQPDNDEDYYEEEAPHEDSAGPDRRPILIIVGAAAVVLVGIALAIFFLQSGSGPDAEPMASRQSQNMAETESQSEQAKVQTPTSKGSHAIHPKFNPSPGSKRTVRLTTHVVTLHKQGERSIEMANTQSVTFNLEPSEATDEDIIPVTVIIARIQTKMETQGIEREFDSAKALEEDSSMTDIYTPFVGRPFTIGVSSQGEITDFGLDKLYLSIAEDRMQAEDKRMSNPQSIERLDQKFGSRRDRTLAMTRQLEAFPILGSEQMRSLLGDLIVPLPGPTTQEDMSWDGFISVQAGMSIDVPATYTLRSLDEDAWLIEGHGERSKDEAHFVYEVGETTITNDLAGSSEVALIVDRHTGWLQRKEQKTELSGQIVGTRNGKQDTNSVSDVTMELTTTVELVE
ncbi:MAG: hypothetical protein HQ515_12745 [Phycisphaeraceae bacterium]|nr:hypothetical protein [Phycisphaeraceae bacterium]